MQASAAQVVRAGQCESKVKSGTGARLTLACCHLWCHKHEKPAISGVCHFLVFLSAYKKKYLFFEQYYFRNSRKPVALPRKITVYNGSRSLFSLSNISDDIYVPVGRGIEFQGGHTERGWAGEGGARAGKKEEGSKSTPPPAFTSHLSGHIRRGTSWSRKHRTERS